MSPRADPDEAVRVLRFRAGQRSDAKPITAMAPPRVGIVDRPRYVWVELAGWRAAARQPDPTGVVDQSVRLAQVGGAGPEALLLAQGLPVTEDDAEPPGVRQAQRFRGPVQALGCAMPGRRWPSAGDTAEALRAGRGGPRGVGAAEAAERRIPRSIADRRRRRTRALDGQRGLIPDLGGRRGLQPPDRDRPKPNDVDPRPDAVRRGWT